MKLPPAFVTGATGWLGTRLVRVLAEGLPDAPEFRQGSDRLIRAFVLPDEDDSVLRSIKGNIQIVRGDLCVPENVEAFLAGGESATVFHTAGIIHPQKGVKQLYEVNVQGTKNLVSAARKAGIRRFIHVSSNSPIGTNPCVGHMFDEKSPYNPYMNYGKSKMLAEIVVNNAAQNFGLETVVIRPPWFYGPDQPDRQTMFFRMVKTGRVPMVGKGSNLRSMAYVDNICLGLLLCESVNGAAGKTYWIADSRPYSMNEIVDTIETVLENDFGMSVAHKRIRLPNVASEFALFMDKVVQGLGYYNSKIHVLSEMNKNIACSIDRARKELGYEPKVDLAEGMRRSVRWVLAKGIVI